MSDYDELMEHARDFASRGFKIEENRMTAISVVAPASASASARNILANDNRHRAPAYVPPPTARSVAVMQNPADVDDLYSIGVKDGNLYLKFTSIPKTVFLFFAVPDAVVQGLRTTIDRDEYFQEYIKDKFSFEVLTAAKK